MYPAAGFIQKVSPKVPRLVINYEKVGENLGLNYTTGTQDYFLQGDCDEKCLELILQLNWFPDILKYKENMCTNSQNLLNNYMTNNPL